MFQSTRDRVARWLGILGLVAAPALTGCEEMGDDTTDDEQAVVEQEEQLQQERQALEEQRRLQQQEEQQELEQEQAQHAQRVEQGQQQPAVPPQGQGTQQQQAQQMPGHPMHGQQPMAGQQEPMAGQQQPMQQQPPQGFAWQQQQPGQQAQQPSQQQRGQLAQQEGASATAQPGARGQIRGTVQQVNIAKGAITLNSDGQLVTVRARPSDLAGIEPGTNVTFSTVMYGDMLWISAPGSEEGLAQSFGTPERVTGRIDSLDNIGGTISVQGRTYAAHPEQLQELAPGQQVTLSYAQVEGARWVGEIQPSSGGATAQAEPQPTDRADQDELARREQLASQEEELASREAELARREEELARMQEEEELAQTQEDDELAALQDDEDIDVQLTP